MENKKILNSILNINEDSVSSIVNELLKTLEKKEKKKLIDIIPPNKPGIYFIFSNDEKDILYIGETGNLCKRHKDIFRTMNHSFRRSFGNFIFKNRTNEKNIVFSNKEKFSNNLEIELTKKIEQLKGIYLPLYLGRKEIEEEVIDQFKKDPKKSKLLYNIKEKRD